MLQDRFGPVCTSTQPYHNFPYSHENEQFTDPQELLKTDHSMQMRRLISLFVPGSFSHRNSLIEASIPESCPLMLLFDLNLWFNLIADVTIASVNIKTIKILISHSGSETDK